MKIVQAACTRWDNVMGKFRDLRPPVVAYEVGIGIVSIDLYLD